MVWEMRRKRQSHGVQSTLNTPPQSATGHHVCLHGLTINGLGDEEKDSHGVQSPLNTTPQSATGHHVCLHGLTLNGLGNMEEESSHGGQST